MSVIGEMKDEKIRELEKRFTELKIENEELKEKLIKCQQLYILLENGRI